MTVTTDLATRFAVARRSPVGVALDDALGQEMQTIAPALMGVERASVMAVEPAWGNAALANAELLGAVRALFGVVGDGRAILSLRPGALVFSITKPNHAALDAVAAQRILTAMMGFLREVESLPAPERRLERTGIEKLADHPERTARWVILAAVVLLGLLSLFVVGGTALLVLFG